MASYMNLVATLPSVKFLASVDSKGFIFYLS